MIINMTGGGAAKGPIKKAVITASYPAGSICTVTDGSRTYQALNTLGEAAFMVDGGEWVISATNGETTVTKSVTAEEGKWVSAELAFDLVLYDAGDQKTNLTGGWKTTNSSYALVENDDSILFKSGMTTIDAIDMSEYSKMYIDVICHSTSGFGVKFGVATSGSTTFIGTNGEFNPTNGAASARTIVSVDLPDSDLTSVVPLLTTLATSVGVSVYKVWLE